MGRRVVFEVAMTPGQEVADLIITSQLRAVGDLAYTLASQVSGLVVHFGELPTVHGDEVTVLDALVCEYAAVSGVIGPRLCFTAARPALKKYPHLILPSFVALTADADLADVASSGTRSRWFRH